MKYHVDIHPELSRIAHKSMPVKYTRHAEDRARQKNIKIASFLDILPGQVFEIERLSCGAPKLAIRKPYDEKTDVCYVLIADRRKGVWVVVTTWLNSVHDGHATLDISKYARAGINFQMRI